MKKRRLFAPWLIRSHFNRIMAAEGRTENEVFQPPKHIQDEAHVSSWEQYEQMYKQSVDDPASFWGDIAKQFYWKSFPACEDGKPFFEYNFDHTKGPISIKWMEGAVTNICYNVLDRNIEKGLGDKIAFYWEGNDPEDAGKITYSQLLKEVCKFANVLTSLGVEKGDRVAIYMPMIIELTVTMLACARIGAIHSIVFAGYSQQSLAERLHGCQADCLVIAGCMGAWCMLDLLFAGYSAEALSDRILDAKCCTVITTDGVWRGTKLLNLKEIVDGAITVCEKNGHHVEHCVVVRHLSSADEDILDGHGDTDNSHTQPPAKRPYRKLKIQWEEGRDKWWHNLMAKVKDKCDPVWMDAEDPIFMLYTSGSTGKPKGVLHTLGGYMLYSATTFKYTFDYHPKDVYWCTADVGWITGHTYVCYGPLANGATGIIFEGVPFYPDASRFWQITDKYKVTKFYTAPTAIRALMKYGDEWVKKCSRQSLLILGTVGEPINPEAWMWYYNVVGEGRCAIVDTFWQTETGGHVITPLPGATPTKPGSATFPFFGIVPAILTDDGKEIDGPGEGYLVFKQPWPGMMRTVYGNHPRFEVTYFKKFPGYYTTGDGARRDEDGYIWITGRIDDMVNVSGHLLSTAEIESALIEHPSVAEAAVVSHPHTIKGECTYAFVTLKQGKEYDEDLVSELKVKVRTKIGPFAQPDFIQNAPGLPKTRSGKIMRRILRKVAVGDRELGDTSTLADESVVETLFKLRPETTS